MNPKQTLEIKQKLGKEYFIAIGFIFWTTTLVRVVGGLTDEQFQYTLLLLLSSVTNFSIPILKYFIRGEAQKQTIKLTLEGSSIVLGVARVYGIAISLTNLLRVLPIPTLSVFATYFTIMSSIQAIFSVWLSWILTEVFED